MADKKNTRTLDLVVMTKDGAEQTVARSSFEKVWKDKGWSIKDERTPQQESGTSAKVETTSTTSETEKAQPKR